MLTKLHVRNFRSLEEVAVPLEPLTAIVGPNGTGKTSLLRAIELVLGEAWPSLRSFRIPQDFTGFDATRDIEIVVGFDPAYIHRDTHSKDHSIVALRLTCKPYKRTGKWGSAGDLHVDIDPLDGRGDVPNVATGQPTKGQKTQFGPLRVGTDLRDHARVLFIDHRRSLTQYLPYMRGSILGRLLEPARKEFTAQDDFRKAYEQAMDLLRTEQVKHIEKIVADTATRMLGFFGGSRGSQVDIRFGFSDPANPFGSLRLQYQEAGLAVPGEELGLGIQSAIVVGIFEAFRQRERERETGCGTLIIEEPEMYLHPQAQRYFFRLLCEMADEKRCQVIYSTHSPIFADVSRFESLRLVRREAGQHSSIAHVPQACRDSLDKARAAFKLGGRFDAFRNEVLFAQRALLVEGYGDRIAALLVAEKLGLNLDAKGITVVDCGGKSGIELVLGVCQNLSIPCAVLHDEDVWPTDAISDDEKRNKLEAENESEKSKNERIRQAAGTMPVFVMTPSLEDALGIGRNAADKPRRIAEALGAIDVTDVNVRLRPLFEAVREVAGAGSAVALASGKS
jgi:putative ATP-dependent endonuclease of OLD family